MTKSRLESLRIKAKLLQKAKKSAGKPIQLKAAFEMIAKAAGFDGWRELKASVATDELLTFNGGGAYWNTWYSSYDEAKKHLSTVEGYLLPFQKQFFVCDEHYIAHLGIQKDDPDLLLVGNNWVEPRDPKAWERLLEKIKKYRQK